MNYQRILSYLYDYDRGVKRKNIGFVKVETRGDLCRMHIHMKLPGELPPESLQAYFFFHRNDEILGILFAGADPEGGEYRLQVTLPASFFEECGFAVEDFAGVYICQEKQRNLVFVSAWDDEPVYVETFRELRPLGKQPESMEEELSKEEGPPNATDLPELPAQTGISELTEPAEETEGTEISGPTGSAEETEETETSGPTRSVEETEKTETSGPTGSAEETEGTETSGPTGTVTAAELSETLEDAEENPGAGAPARSSWEELAKNFTKLRIVDGEDTVECLKIRPHHLALLPRRYWNDTNSSFLLHGYYAYGHVILARRGSGEAYFLGIPGKKRDRDRVMAAYYGYTSYLPTGRKNGVNGYWCKEITLST